MSYTQAEYVGCMAHTGAQLYGVVSWSLSREQVTQVCLSEWRFNDYRRNWV